MLPHLVQLPRAPLISTESACAPNLAPAKPTASARAPERSPAIPSAERTSATRRAPAR
jgi:hypothetical protein